MRKSLFWATVAALTLATSQQVVAQNDVDQQLGNVNFKTSCNDVAQRRFDRGMRYQHSFWYINAKEVFEEAWPSRLNPHALWHIGASPSR